VGDVQGYQGARPHGAVLATFGRAKVAYYILCKIRKPPDGGFCSIVFCGKNKEFFGFVVKFEVAYFYGLCIISLPPDNKKCASQSRRMKNAALVCCYTSHTNSSMINKACIFT